MIGFDQLRDALMGERPQWSPPLHDHPDDAAAILAQLEETKPTLERGQAWLTQARSDRPFLDHHQQSVLAAVPALRVSATTSWITLMDADGWDPELDSYPLVRLLTAMLAWQVAAAQRSLVRFHIEADALPQLVWRPLVGECERYLVDQSASDTVMGQLRHAADHAATLINLALVAPEPEESATGLVEATQGWCGLHQQTAAPALLASQWRIMDVAALGVWYRAFGEQLQRQPVR